jgi:lysyl-tRNA synthetase class 2
MSDNWQASSGPEVAAQRAELKRRARHYFRDQSVLEVDTPTLAAGAPADPNIESFEIATSDVAGRPLYLHTSPEYAMKRLLASGYPDIYSICRVFRDGEQGRMHQPEFTMIEWYRLGFGLDAIVADTAALISAILDRELAINRLHYRDAVRTFSGIDPLTATMDELTAATEPGLLSALGDDRDAWLDLLFSLKVAPRFDRTSLTVIDSYPISQAALARPNPDKPAVADRFEVFLGDVELANGYVELTDATEFARRQAGDLDKRQSSLQAVRPTDDRFLAAMQQGLPDCAGVAMGFERLHMIAASTNDIRHVICLESAQ